MNPAPRPTALALACRGLLVLALVGCATDPAPQPDRLASGAGGQGGSIGSVGAGSDTGTMGEGAAQGVGGEGGNGGAEPCPTDPANPTTPPGCAGNLERLCARHTDERSCSGEPVVAAPFGLVQCGWARVVTVEDPGTCALGAIGGRCYALTESFLGCSDPCDEDTFSGFLLAMESESLLVELPCAPDGGELSGPITEGMFEDGATSPFYPCVDAEELDPPPICDCVPQACESK